MIFIGPCPGVCAHNPLQTLNRFLKFAEFVLFKDTGLRKDIRFWTTSMYDHTLLLPGYKLTLSTRLIGSGVGGMRFVEKKDEKWIEQGEKR